MATEEVFMDGQKFVTLRELLRPGLRAVFVGINPSLVSVEKGHYLQGRLGRRFWDRLRAANITPVLPTGVEDDAAFTTCHYGFADLVRRPTRSAKDLSKKEKQAGASDLSGRLTSLKDRPIIIFVYEEARKHAGPRLESAGFSIYRMPGPYAARAEVMRVMRRLKDALSIRRKVTSN